MKNEKLDSGRILVIPIQVHQMKVVGIFFWAFSKISAVQNPFNFDVRQSEITLVDSELPSPFSESR